jgi:hypothetical protein
MKHHVDSDIGRWAADNDGVISRDEALQLGISDDQLEKRVTSERLVIVHDGVYRVAGAPDTWHGRLRAATLAAGDAAFASHHAFARLMNLRGTYQSEPEITVVGTQLPILDGVRVHRIDRIDPVDVRRCDGIPCLAPPLGLLTLGARLHERGVHNAVHDAVKLGLTAPIKLDEILRRYGGRGRRGTASFRLALKGFPPSGRASETGLELDAYRLIVNAGLPEPELQHRIVDGNGENRRLDIAYLPQRVDVECDSERWHDPIEDARRDAAMRAIGWEVLRFDDKIIYGHPERMLRKIADTLRERSHPRSLSA